ncbi:MAG TPA: DUF2867 domain-containing protein [Candidatus Cybelea sp.]
MASLDPLMKPSRCNSHRPEFERLPLRAHEFLDGVPLHDVWTVDLPRIRRGITLAEFLARANCLPRQLPPGVRTLLSVRFFIGGLFGWDRASQGSISESFALRLTDEDRTRSLVSPGTRDGLFRIVYRFENEQLNEVINRTAHAAALSVLVEGEASYRYYFAVYVREVNRLTRYYMAAIDPFRKWIVYPALLGGIAEEWNAIFAG